MELKVLNDQGQETAQVAASDSVFAREYNEPLVHQLVVAYQANSRQGTRKQLSRAEVKHSTRKPWRQKGTGRGRSGMSSSPVWRGGGRAFPNTPDENFTKKINKKMVRGAMACIYSRLAKENRLAVVENMDVETPKTKQLALKLKNMGIDNALIITNDISENLDLASRNLKNIWVVEPRYADPLSLIFFKKILVTKDAVTTLEEMWG